MPDPKKNAPFTDPGINNFKYPNSQTNTVTNPIVNFLGPDADVGEPLYGTRFIPPDTNAAVGPNNVIAITNMGLRIYDKSGNPLTAQFRLSTLLVGIPNAGDDDGDPVVLYDTLADRWIISQFNLTVTSNSTHQHIAVSKTGDPTGAYYAYDFLMTANRPADYPHMGVWHDGYYMSTNDFSLPVFSNPFQGAGLYAFERAKMLVGDPTAMVIRFNTNNQHGGMLPTNLQGFTPAPVGTPNLFYEFDADEFGAATDLVRTFAFHADFATPANSTLTQGPDIPTTPFDARTSRMQQPPPGEDLDGLNDRLMHAVNFRVLSGGVQSYVLDFTVNVSGVNPTSSALYQGGVRWMEMRRNAGTGVVSINQQATYAPGSGSGVGRDVWMAAIAQDGEGNIGLGMSASAPGPTPAALNPTALYTGRLAGDPANTLPQGEVDALSAVTRGVQLSNSFNRWGDYSSLFIDPSDDCTFWGAFEYVDSPNATFDWNTRIFSFKVNPTCVTAPRGTINGTITNCSGGTPIPNAVITTPDGFIRQSNASGQFSMTVAPGTYTVTVTGPPGSGFGTCTQQVTVAANGTGTVNCCLAAAAIITSGGATLVSESCAPANGAIDPGETVTVSLCVQNTGASNTTALMGTLQATGGVTGIQPPNPQNYGVVVAGGPAVCRNFTFTASGTCGGTITATVHFVDGATDLGNVTYTFLLGAAGAPMTFSFTGPAVTIPDSSAAGVNIPITVAGAGSVSDINFRIDGSSCNTNNPSLTVGVDHSWVGDLKFTLTSPGGTSVVLMNRPGGGTFGASGNNFCQTLLDDDGAFPSIQSIASTGAPPLGPPYTGTFTPSSPLSAFDGQNANGTWTLNVSDNAAGDTGFVRAFSLIITPLACSTSCATPCVITCPANITKSNDPNQCGAVVTYPAPTSTGTCGTITCTPASGSFFPVGTTTVTCQASAGGTAPTTTAPSACTTITESTSQAIVDNNSVSCNNGVGHTDNSYWRAFNLTSFGINGAFDVMSVDIGIELASAGTAGIQAAAPNISKHKKVGSHAPNGGGSQPITVRLYTSSQPFPTGYPASLTLIGSVSTTIADQSDTILNIPVTGTAPAGSQLVVEVFTPDGEVAGNLIFIGSNTAAETGPSYLSAAACGITTPTTTAAIGFPDMHIVMNVNGCEQVGGTGPTCSFTVTVNDTQPPVITCPANITAATPTVNNPCTVVNFTTTASDNCPGVTVVCNPPSGSCFPTGVTTVTCTATDAHSNTATCSFTVSVFNGRLEDDSEGCNDTVLFNTLTGDYRWCCHGTTFTGRGKVTRSGDTITLNHVAADRRVLINMAAGAPTPTGNGSLQFPAGTTRCTLSDRDTRNDVCLCGNAPPPSSKQ